MVRLVYLIFDSETFKNGTVTSILDSVTFRNGYVVTDSFLNESKNGEVGEGRGQTPKCLAYPIFDSETFRNGYAVADSFLKEFKNG